MGNTPYNDQAGTRRVVLNVGFVAAATASHSVTLLNHDDPVVIESVEIQHGIPIVGHVANRKNINIFTGTDASPTVTTERANVDYLALVDRALGERETVWAPAGGHELAAEEYLIAQIEHAGAGVNVCPSIIVSYRVQE